MSVYGFMVCEQCVVHQWLGKAIRSDPDDEERVSFYWIGDRERGPSWANPENRVLWKFLADHAGHQLRPMIEWEWDEFLGQLVERYGDLDDLTVDVDGDTVHDVSAEEYVQNWPG